MTLPSRRIVPLAGRYSPQMQFSTEVLPAPFGPTSANSSPGRGANETPCRTCRPPKARRIDSTRSSAIPAAGAAILLHVAIVATRADAAEIELGDIGMRA